LLPQSPHLIYNKEPTIISNDSTCGSSRACLDQKRSINIQFTVIPSVSPSPHFKPPTFFLQALKSFVVIAEIAWDDFPGSENVSSWTTWLLCHQIRMYRENLFFHSYIRQVGV
jgi:hypothetical protein